MGRGALGFTGNYEYVPVLRPAPVVFFLSCPVYILHANFIFSTGRWSESLESEFCDKTFLVLKKPGTGTALIGMFLQLSIERVQRQRQLYASLDASGATIK
jgi:hypothetical protein